MENMKSLYEKVSTDTRLRQRFKEIIRNDEKAGAEEMKEKLIAFAREAGFDITIEEMKEFFSLKKEETGGELSEAELDMVAGGKLTFGGAVLGGALSALTIGIGCIVVSVQHSDCDSYYNNGSRGDLGSV